MTPEEKRRHLLNTRLDALALMSRMAMTTSAKQLTNEPLIELVRHFRPKDSHLHHTMCIEQIHDMLFFSFSAEAFSQHRVEIQAIANQLYDIWE